MKINKLIIYSLLPFVLAGCADLEYNEVTIKSKDYVLASRSGGVEQLVTNVYSYLDYDFGDYGGAMLASACDEAEYAWSTSSIKTFYNGSWSAINDNSSTWENSYAGIRAANFFLENAANLTFDDFKYNLDYNSWMKKYSYFQYEVRFLRAYYHFNLAREYGDVPLITKTLSTDEASKVTRTNVQEVYKFIADECDAILNNLPVNYANNEIKETGRINKPAVLALKARALLYAASPLFNTANNSSLYEAAARANKAVIDSCTKWGITMGTYASLWGDENFKNKEILLGRRVAASNSFEANNFPVGVEGGKSGNCPTQTLVDAYELKATGKVWNEVGSGFDAANPYTGLDPRFGFTIVRNGDTGWPTYNTNPIETFVGGRNGAPLTGATSTGYYLKKYCDKTVDLRPNSSNTKRHTWIIFRLAEFYLNYAEALFYWQNKNNTFTNAEFIMSPLEAANKVRSRSDVAMPAIPTVDNFETRLRRERMVELAFENHRFWDVRRWKIGAQTQNNISLLTITKNSTDQLVYTRIVKPRIWDDKMNLFPIPDTERRKNPNLNQNLGWN
jgi:hypothetical protein